MDDPRAEISKSEWVFLKVTLTNLVEQVKGLQDTNTKLLGRIDTLEATFADMAPEEVPSHLSSCTTVAHGSRFHV